MDRVLVKRWLAGHQAAGRRVLEQMRQEGPPAPDVSFTQAMELLDLAAGDDPFRESDAATARAVWVKLRAWAASHASR